MKVKLAIPVVLLIVILLLPLGACATKETQKDNKPSGEIVIGILDDLSGPMAGTASAFVDGELDCIRYINEEKGGILGHPLRPIVIDFKMDPTLAISGWDRLRGEKAPVIMSLLGAAAPILAQSSQKDHIPMITGSGSLDQLFPKEPSFYFAMGPQLTGVFDSLCKIIEKDWSKGGKARTPKVGFDFISLGSTPKVLGKAAKINMDKLGWGYTITYTSIGPADVTTQVLQMKNFGCDYIYLHGTEAAIIVWLKELDRQNFHPKIFGTVSLGSNEVLAATKDLAVGTSFYQFGVQWTDTNIPGVNLARELNTKWHPEVKWRPGHYFRGFAGILAVTEAVKRAIEKAGYENLNGDAMKEALETISNVDPLSMGMGYTWTPTDHQGLPGCRWCTWTKEGTIAAISDWYVFEPLPQEQRTDVWWLQN